jgi:hypothetical protein
MGLFVLLIIVGGIGFPTMWWSVCVVCGWSEPANNALLGMGFIGAVCMLARLSVWPPQAFTERYEPVSTGFWAWFMRRP